MNEEIFYRLPDVAAILKISGRTARRLIAQNKLTSHRVGRCLRISRADLNAYIEGTRNEGGQHEQSCP